MERTFDVVVVGGGHAGVEAARAATRLGADTALVTMRYESIARMSCNPAIGGLGKGQMVCEIDALGGLMGQAIDLAGIQFRVLNRSKGPAVWAPRAQADRESYPKAVQTLLSQARSLTVIEGSVEAINTRSYRGPDARPRVRSVTLADGRVLTTRAVIITTGTFLRGLMHCGRARSEGGRIAEPAAMGLSHSLKSLGFTLGRLKTGTPPRIHRDSIHYTACERQSGDEIPMPFSTLTHGIHQPQIDCWITWTNALVHQHIRANLHRAPMYSGQIQSTGPRYCPSIEDKVVRFADKPKHQIFLEPEGFRDERVYCNGISTSLPKDVQEAFLHEVVGLENARILQHGYAVEYDFVPTHQTRISLETKRVSGLFLAGQINGTSGYEEAAGQGLMAGINAVRLLHGQHPFVLGRDEAYIGVMIDDLITRPPSEPYRMFTSRAEYRLRLRADNADQRLTPLGRGIGTVNDVRWAAFQRKSEAVTAIEAFCDNGRVEGIPMRTWMCRPGIDEGRLAEVLSTTQDRIYCTDALRQVLINVRYSGYVERQAKQIEKFRKLESMSIPCGIDYTAMPELRLEAREHLGRISPQTLGQAGRISGISPADLTVLMIYLTGRRSVPKAPKTESGLKSPAVHQR